MISNLIGVPTVGTGRVGGMELGHFYRRRARAACGQDDGRRYCLRSRSPHVALPRRAPRPKPSPQRLLPLVPRPEEPRETGRRPWNGLGVANERNRAALAIKEVQELGGEGREDVSVGQGAPYVRRQERERAVGRQDWRWRGGGHGHDAVKGVRTAVRTGSSRWEIGGVVVRI